MANEVIPEALRRRYIDSFPGKCAAFDAVIEQLNGADAEADHQPTFRVAVG